MEEIYITITFLKRKWKEKGEEGDENHCLLG